MDLRKGKLRYHPFQYVIQILKIVSLFALFFSCVFAINHFRLSKYFPITSVKVYGLNHLDHSDVKSLVMPLVARGFFGVNVDFIRDRLLQQPWVADIFVRRNWPDQIEITVIEKNAIARWNKHTLLSEGGVIFTPKLDTYPANLPIFIGPDGMQIVMLNYFNKINRILAPLHVKISCLELTSYLTWKLALDNGITLQIGHKDILTRLAHFVRVYPKIVRDHPSGVDSVDLRYPNGAAVHWKSPARI